MENMKINYRDSMKEDSFVNGDGGVPVHSQVRKIKQESENILDWLPGKPEIRPVVTRQVSRSPLGISGRPISVGDS